MNRDIELMVYENPDMPGVFAGLRKFNAVAVNRDYDFIPSLQERLSLAARTLSQGVRTIVDQIRHLDVVVESSGLDALLEQWAAIQAHTQLTADMHSAAITTLNDTCAQRISRIVSAVGTAKEHVLLRIDEGRGLNLDHYSDPLLAYDVARLEALEQQALILQIEEDKLRGDKQVIDAAVTLLQTRTWLDHVRDLLPSAEQIQALVTSALVGKAEADVVVAAIERVTLYLGFFDGGYRLFALTEARNKITDKLSDVRMLKSKNMTDARGLKERAEKIRRHAELVEARTYWVDNMKRVARGLGEFIARVHSTTEVNEHLIQQVSAELAGFQRFLRQISR